MAVKPKISELPDEIVRTIDPKLFNDAYYPYLHGIWHYEVYFGSAGSGKSFYIAQKIAIQMSAIPNRNMLCLRKSANDSRDSVYPEILGALRDFKLMDIWSIVEHPKIRMTNLVNGNEIVFDGMDNVENIKSIKFKNGNLTDVWYEEATEETDKGNITQLDLRLRDRFQKGRIILSFNPVSSQHFLKKMIEKELVPSGDCVVLKTTYKDNRFLPKSYANTLEALRTTDPYRYMVYALGEWGVMGDTVFDRNVIHSRLQDLTNVEYLSGQFSYDRDDLGHVLVDSFKFFEMDKGEVKVFRQPEARHPYVMSLDTAGEGSDYHAAHVIDNISGEQVAVYRSQQNPDHCVYQAFGLAQYYNNAMFVPEVNFDSYHMNKFRELGYRNIYQRGSALDDYNENYVQKLGFRTTVGNRQKMLSDCVEFVNKNAKLINDADTLNEMLTFTRQEKKMKGIWWGAEPGAHDDCFVAGTMVLTNRGQVPIETIKVGDMVLTRNGYCPVVKTRNRYKPVITRFGLTGTPTHPVITRDGQKAFYLINDSDIIYVWNEKQSIIEEKTITDIRNPSGDNSECITGDMTRGNPPHLHYIVKYGSITSGKFPKDTLFTTKMGIRSIMKLATLNVSRKAFTVQDICFQKKDETNQLKMESDNPKGLFDSSQSGKKEIRRKPIGSLLKTGKDNQNQEAQILQSGERKILIFSKKSQAKTVKKPVLKDGEKIEKVYNLQVLGTPEYFANNVLVHNCVMAYAIVLQARQQAPCVLGAEQIGDLKGFWLKEELDAALNDGIITLEQKNNYLKKQKTKNIVTLGGMQKKKRGRYGR